MIVFQSMYAHLLRITIVVANVALIALSGGCTMEEQDWHLANTTRYSQPWIMGYLDSRARGGRQIVVAYSAPDWNGPAITIPADEFWKPTDPFCYAGVNLTAKELTSTVPSEQRRAVLEHKLNVYAGATRSTLEHDPAFHAFLYGNVLTVRATDGLTATGLEVDPFKVMPYSLDIPTGAVADSTIYHTLNTRIVLVPETMSLPSDEIVRRKSEAFARLPLDVTLDVLVGVALPVGFFLFHWGT